MITKFFKNNKLCRCFVRWFFLFDWWIFWRERWLISGIKNNYSLSKWWMGTCRSFERWTLRSLLYNIRRFDNDYRRLYCKVSFSRLFWIDGFGISWLRSWKSHWILHSMQNHVIYLWLSRMALYLWLYTKTVTNLVVTVIFTNVTVIFTNVTVIFTNVTILFTNVTVFFTKRGLF